MVGNKSLLGAAVFVGLIAGVAPAQAKDPVVEFEKYTLENGLEVILHQDNRVPIVAVNVWYHVGSGDEQPGKSGFAHLFEHMLFQGSKHVGEDRHFDVLKNIGASSVNGTTNSDRTNYFEVVPSHQLETALWLESDRMGYLLPMLTEKSFNNQQEVVRNERRQRYDNVAYGKTRFAVAKALYPEGHPYRYLTIGRHEDLSAATLQDVSEFYKQWYVPANATLVLAGDFEKQQAKELVKKWFGGLKLAPKPERKAPKTPVLSAEKSVEISDEFAKLRKLDYVWISPAFFAEGDAELDIVAQALGARGTGRLYKILVHEKQLAQRVMVYQGSRQLSSEFVVSIVLKNKAKLDEVKKIVDEELAKVANEEISKREFDRAIVAMESSFIWGLESLMARAELLQRYNHYVGKPNYISDDLNRWRSTNPAKVKSVVNSYLGKSNRAVVLTSPAKK